MSDRNPEGLSERERTCLTHLREAQGLGVSFSRYCRERDLKFQQWAWVKRVLIRKGVIDGRRPAGKAKAAGFAAVRVAPPVAPVTVCRIRHPSGWTIECASFPEVSWMSALMSGEAA
jgi:hypothetical protein